MTANVTPMIEAHGLTSVYGDRVAVEGVNFAVARGEIFGFLGPNGAGKSATVRMLTGYVPPSEGFARVAGFDVRLDPVAARARATRAAAKPRPSQARSMPRPTCRCACGSAPCIT